MKLFQAILLTLMSSISFATSAEQAIAIANVETQDTINITAKILNGADVISKDFTHYAQLIEYTEGDNFYYFTCGASVINDSFILTAAHCVDSYDTSTPDNLRVVTKNQSSQSLYIEEFRTVKSISIYPYWDTDNVANGDDIAVIELNYPILDNISSMRLAIDSDTDKALAAEKLKIIGNGLVDNSNSATTLQQGDVFSMSNDACNTLTASNAYDELICTKSIIDGMDEEDSLSETCSGDSGGPLHYFDEDEQRYQQVGVVSYGLTPNCQFTEYYSAFTKISHYNNWLTSIITYGNELTYDASLEDGSTRSTGEDGTFLVDDETEETDESSSSGGSTNLLSLFLLAFIVIGRKTLKIEH